MTLQPFHHMNVNKTRQEIDAALCRILGLDPKDMAEIRDMLVREPLVNAGNKQTSHQQPIKGCTFYQ